MRSVIALALLASASPLAVPMAAHAQLSPQEQFRQLEVDQRLNQIQSQLDNAAIQRSSEENLRRMVPPASPQVVSPVPYPTIVVVQSADARNKQLAAQLAEANARLKAYEEAEKKAGKPDVKQEEKKP